MLIEFECPKCKGHACDIWSLHSPNPAIRLMLWHMLLNPGIAFNEVVLGQRFAAVTHICKSCTSPLVERTYVVCPNCNACHSSLAWTGRKAYGNWSGLLCTRCGAVIPSLLNFTSRGVMMLTAPLSRIPLKALRGASLERRQQRIALASHIAVAPTMPPKEINYTQVGVSFGVLMFLGFTFLFPLLMLLAINGLTWASYLRVAGITFVPGIVLWPLAGLVFGAAMKFTLGRRGDPKLHLTFDDHGQIADLIADNEDSNVSSKPTAPAISAETRDAHGEGNSKI